MTVTGATVSVRSGGFARPISCSDNYKEYTTSSKECITFLTGNGGINTKELYGRFSETNRL